ncbi:MAG: hypothetical protein M5U34_00710 [Chloroflexi bacterium]|nr:hypothetical protein [Chloroflexota bacterium]
MNNIIVDQTECGVAMFNGITLYVDYNLFDNNDTDICGSTAAPPHANIFAGPLFADAANGNYYLQPGSPAVDSGFAGPGVPDVDIEGVSRPQGSGVDMGAYEAVFNQVFLPTVMKPVEISNIALGKPVQITTNGANDPYIGSGLSPADVTDGSLAYKAVSSSEEDGVIGFVNQDYNQEMEVTATIDLGGNYDITSIRYTPGNVQFANYWHPDWMITPLQTTTTVPGTPYYGAWTEHTGNATLSSVTVTFKTTRSSFYEDWFLLAKLRCMVNQRPDLKRWRLGAAA